MRGLSATPRTTPRASPERGSAGYYAPVTRWRGRRAGTYSLPPVDLFRGSRKAPDGQQRRRTAGAVVRRGPAVGSDIVLGQDQLGDKPSRWGINGKGCTAATPRRVPRPRRQRTPTISGALPVNSVAKRPVACI